ncbi:MAG: hypothetical protein FJX77_15990 [Armatimonadetes bacterium]|nr:hypothetical protein [Armatimonadota bacterium]
MQPLAADLAPWEELFQALEERTRAELEAEGLESTEIRLERFADVRYRGQSYELRLPVESPDGTLLRARFDAAHEHRFGFANRSRECEVVHVRVRGVGQVESPALPRAAARPPGRPYRQTRAYVGEGWVACPVYRRGDLALDQEMSGPAILTQEDATTWVAPGWVARVDGWENLILRPDANP